MATQNIARRFFGGVIFSDNIFEKCLSWKIKSLKVTD